MLDTTTATNGGSSSGDSRSNSGSMNDVRDCLSGSVPATLPDSGEMDVTLSRLVKFPW